MGGQRVPFNAPVNAPGIAQVTLARIGRGRACWGHVTDPPCLLDTPHTPTLSRTQSFVCDLDMTDYSPYNALKAWVATLAYTAR